ncbi:hypothetical protein [Streptomyces carpaticus]|uniref:DUF3558 domain-containing protein n=1 Tax=Streptomyces carpaticus TaxID=285558 RepID=A0ABV4ZS84_9ACTN
MILEQLESSDRDNVDGKGYGVKITRITSLFAVSVLATAACTTSSSEDTKVYTLPAELCSTRVDSQSFEPVFPAGEELEIETQIPYDSAGDTPATHNCVATVDGIQAFSLSSIPATRAAGLEDYISERGYRFDIDDSVPARASGYDVLAWQSVAIGFAPCTASELDSSGVGFMIHLGADHELNDIDALVEALGSYMDGRISQINPKHCTFS